ncbi:TraR/DksA family transcriptional regulator [Nannocystis radixulma]|uniref:TraR/DksA family transcriptional regulator n=1 Tax=Nannocystis radixulma TaxID=2995305 RepID=UPI00358DD3F4
MQYECTAAEHDHCHEALGALKSKGARTESPCTPPYNLFALLRARWKANDRSRLREVGGRPLPHAGRVYGICEDTEEEIPFKRLWARPTARLTIEAKDIREREARARALLREACGAGGRGPGPRGWRLRNRHAAGHKGSVNAIS